MNQTMQEHIDMIARMKETLPQLAIEKIVVPEASKMTASIIRRVTHEGRRTDGSKLPAYSKEPMYVTQKQFVSKGGFVPQGKDGFKGERIVSEKKYKVVKKKLKDGRIQERLVSQNRYKVVKDKPKSMYLPEGYHQFRAVQGRRTDIMNWELTGDLINDFGMESQPNQKRVLIGFRSELQALKRQGLEDGTDKKKGFGKVFPPSKDEIQEYKEGVTAQTEDLHIQIITNSA